MIRTRWFSGHVIEGIAFLVMVGCFIWVAVTAVSNGYLPQPFYFMADDTFMDWFNTAWWARDPGTYDNWLTVYPPLSFVILKLSGLPYCYDKTGIGFTRDCDWYGLAVLHGIFVLNIFLTAKTFLKIDRATALPRAFALSAGMPMLFGLERGNLAILAYTFLLLAYGPLVRSAKMRWLCVGLAINLKVYIIAGLAAQLLRRKWRAFEGGVIATILVYLVSYAIHGAGTPAEIYENLVNFATGFKPDAVIGTYYVNSYNALHYALTDPQVPAHLILGSDYTAIGAALVTAAIRVTQVIILAAAAATWLRPEAVPPYRVTLLGLGLAMVTTETGPYTAPMMLLFAFMEPWKGIMRPIAIVCCYILCLPGDIYLGYFASLYRYSFLFQDWVFSDQYITLGMFLRPLFFSLVPICLSLQTIYAVYGDVRQQGWGGRWRFRRDLSILPLVRRPSFRPAAGGLAEDGSK